MKDPTFKTFTNPLKEIERSQQELEKRIFHLKTLYDLSQEIGFLRGTPEITRNLLMMIMGTFGASNGFILLMNMNEARIETFTQRGFAKNALDPFSETLESEIFKALDQATNVLILDKPEENWREMESLLNLLCSLSIKIWIPFAINSQLRGSIALGEKLSGDSYTLDDQEFLSTMAHQGAVAIENAQLVDQMKSEETVRTNLARYLSPQIVEQIIQKNVQVNLGGDRKVVTVLFSDIRNFTRISESLPPDKLVHLLNEYFTEMAKIIFENQGSLDKYIGDAIVAVFGSLIPLENPGRTAVQAAIQMMKELSSLNESWKTQYGFGMDIGIGINTGEVFLGNIGSPERMEFTVIGDTVNIASRFSEVAKGGQILITKETQSEVQNIFEIRELPPVSVKGKSEALPVYEVHYGPSDNSK